MDSIAHTANSGTSFNLRDLAKQVLAESNASDPGALTDELLDRIPADLRIEALRQCLRSFMLQTITQQRMANPISPSANMPSKAPKSWKVRAIREGWQRALENRMHVAEGQWKKLRDCTHEDLMFAASQRQQMADRNAAIARSLHGLAALLTEHQAATVNDLPVEIQMQALGAAA